MERNPFTPFLFELVYLLAGIVKRLQIQAKGRIRLIWKRGRREEEMGQREECGLKSIKTIRSFFAAAAIAAICLNLTSRASGAESLPAPTVWWSVEEGETGIAKWSCAGSSGGGYLVELYRDDTQVFSMKHIMEAAGSECGFSLAPKVYIEETGAYRFRVKAFGEGTFNEKENWSSWSGDFHYQRPAIQFEKPQNAAWSQNSVTWQPPTDPVSQMYADSIWGYELYLKQDGEVITWMFSPFSANSVLWYDLSDFLTEPGTYTCQIRCISAEPEVIANGVWSEEAPVYYSGE